MQGISFGLLFLAILFLPGIAFYISSNVIWRQHAGFLCSLGGSYALFVLLVGSFQILGLSWTSFAITIGLIQVISGLAIVLLLRRVCSLTRGMKVLANSLVPAVIVACVSCYHLVWGGYAEIPADVYAHLGYLKKAFELQLSGSVGDETILRFLSQKGLVWYHLLAFCRVVSGADVETVLYVTTWLTKTLFLLGVYCFSLKIFEAQQYRRAIALLATLFVALHMGINVMAFVRYYSFAPTMLNFVLYFSAIVVFLDFLKQTRLMLLLGQGCYILLLIVAAAAIHTQEALFILVMLTMIAFAEVVIIRSQQDILNGYLAKIILASAVASFFVIYYFAQAEWDRAPNIGWRLWEFGHLYDWLPTLTTLNLKYQFIRVVTLWGVLVYIAAIFCWRDIRQNVFLLAGLVSPVFTILNPFFVDLFLRFDNSTTLWRLSYLIPLHFTAAFLAVKTAQRCLCDHTSWLRKIAGSVFIVLLVVLLLPWKNTFAGLHYSRFPTLRAVDSQNSYEHIADALQVLNNDIKAKHIILTDPVTGYVVSGMTQHYSYRYKFLPRNYINFTFDDYSDFPLRRHKGKLLLINLRSGSPSQVGALARHWSESVLNVSRYYPPALIQHLDANPQRFERLWFSDDAKMRLYKIL